MPKILICEDDSNIIEIVTVILEGEGYEVQALNNGRGIIKVINNFKPDLIFLDIWMSGINGKEVAGLIRKDQSIKDTPIIIISALSESEVKTIVKDVKATGYLLKPFTFEQILHTVKQYTS